MGPRKHWQAAWQDCRWGAGSDTDQLAGAVIEPSWGASGYWRSRLMGARLPRNNRLAVMQSCKLFAPPGNREKPWNCPVRS
jgi:hypothetical protein